MNKKNILKYFIFVFSMLTLFISMGYSQKNAEIAPLKISHSFLKDSVMIGDQFILKVIVDKDIMQVTEFPDFGKTFGNVLEILNEGEIDTVSRDNRRIILHKDYLLTSFDAGNYTLGAFPLLSISKNTIDTIFSQNSLSIVVNTFVVDTTKHAIVDITEQLDAPILFAEIKHYIYGGLLGIIIIGLLIYFAIKYIKRRRNKVTEKPLLPPHIEAMNELEKIYPLKLWQGGEHKLYYTKLTDIIRVYIERRYEIGAMEMTTDEIFSAIKKINISVGSESKLREFLSLSDLVKFAKYEALEQENEDSFKNAYNFVMDTRPVIIENSENIKDEIKK